MLIETRHAGSSRPYQTLCMMLVVLSLLVFAACGSDEESSSGNAGRTVSDQSSAKSYSGEESFTQRCAVCHGPVAGGTAAGPPLVHRLYEIGHHPDFSFRNAVNNGVQAHHWNFGDMPAIPNVPPEEIDAIICHVRDLQRADGIEAGEPC